MTLFAMVTTAGSAMYTDGALESFFRHTPLSGEDRFVLIDNDGGFSLRKESQQFPIDVVINPIPISFAANANNMAARALQMEAPLIFLNNDVIFTAGWSASFREDIDVVTVPVSNRELQYALADPDGATRFQCAVRMSLDDYRGHEANLAQVVALHQARAAADWLPVLCAPFFVVKIPLRILRDVGAFDLRFGVGGGEDYDYCLRCHLAGFSVAYAQRSFLLHFGGKSIEVEEQVEPAFVKEFRKKWGDSATDLIFDDAPGVIENLGVSGYDSSKNGFVPIIKDLIGDRTNAIRLVL